MHNGIDGVLRCVYNRIDHDGALNRSVQACRVALESDFSRFDPSLASPGGPETGPHFSNFGPPAAPTLATLLAAWIEDLFAEAPVGAGSGPRRTLAHRGPSDRL